MGGECKLRQFYMRLNYMNDCLLYFPTIKQHDGGLKECQVICKDWMSMSPSCSKAKQMGALWKSILSKGKLHTGVQLANFLSSEEHVGELLALVIVLQTD